VYEGFWTAARADSFGAPDALQAVRTGKTR
jgi:hypothetical protein